MTFETPVSLDGLTGRYLGIDKTPPYRSGRMIAHTPAALQGKVCFTQLQDDALVQYVEYVYRQGAVAVLGTGYCPQGVTVRLPLIVIDESTARTIANTAHHSVVKIDMVESIQPAPEVASMPIRSDNEDEVNDNVVAAAAPNDDGDDDDYNDDYNCNYDDDDVAMPSIPQSNTTYASDMWTYNMYSRSVRRQPQRLPQQHQWSPWQPSGGFIRTFHERNVNVSSVTANLQLFSGLAVAERMAHFISACTLLETLLQERALDVVVGVCDFVAEQLRKSSQDLLYLAFAGAIERLLERYGGSVTQNLEYAFVSFFEEKDLLKEACTQVRNMTAVLPSGETLRTSFTGLFALFQISFHAD